MVASRRLDRRLEQIAMTLVRIQEASIRGVPAALRSAHRLESWEPRRGQRRNELVERAIRYIRQNLTDALRSKRAGATATFIPAISCGHASS